MTGRRYVGLAAGLATLLAALPLSTIFEQWTWLIQCIIAVVLVEAAGTLARTLRAPAWGQLVAMLFGLGLVLTLLFPSGHELLGVIPTGGTIVHFGQLLSQAGTGIREMGIPVSDQQGLLFLTALGVGSVAVCVDVCAVALRRPALAGLPMLAIYSVPVAVHQDSVSVLPFIAGAVGFLWLLVVDNVDRVRRFGRRFSGDGRDIDAWEPSPLAAAGRRMAIVGVLVAVILPIAVPGMTTGLLDRWGTGGGGSGPGNGNGRGGTVNLWALLEGELRQQQETDMIKITTKDPDPYYLRFGVADDLSVDGFRNRQPSGRTANNNLPDPRKGDHAGVSYYEGHASVEVVNLNMALLPVYSEPTRLQKVDSTWLYDSRMNVIFSNRSTTNKRRYEFDYVRARFDPAALRRADPVPANSDIRRQFTSVPNVEGVAKEVARLTEGKTNEYDRVRALYDYFSIENGFTYSLVAKADTSGNAMVDFLTKKSGYCVQYAAALAWMVRAAGIPARVAFGFTHGSKHEGDTYTLTSRNLHAWTEVYFEGFGWVPFDATPSTYIIGSVRPGWAPNVDAPENGLPGNGPTPDPGGTVSPGATHDPLDDPRLEGGSDLSGGVLPGTGGSSRWPWYALAAGIVIILLLAMPSARRVLLRRRRMVRPAIPSDVAVSEASDQPRVVVAGGPQAARARLDAHAAWEELIDTLVDFRLLVDLAETPRTTADRLVREAGLRDATADGARLLGRAEELARYARVPLLTTDLTPALRAVRRALGIRAPRRTRWQAALLPPSVLQRWRSTAITWTATVLETVGVWRDALVRVLSPRRLLPGRSGR